MTFLRNIGIGIREEVRIKLFVCDHMVEILSAVMKMEEEEERWFVGEGEKTKEGSVLIIFYF